MRVGRSPTCLARIPAAGVAGRKERQGTETAKKSWGRIPEDLRVLRAFAVSASCHSVFFHGEGMVCTLESPNEQFKDGFVNRCA